MANTKRTDTKSCKGVRKDGKPCESPTLVDGTYCFAHSPTTEDQRTEARSRGGKNSAKVVRLLAAVPPRLAPIYGQLEKALEEVHDGKLKPQAAQAMAGLARAMVAVLERSEFEDRLKAIEEALASNLKRTG